MKPRISETEWEVMRPLWAKAPRTTGEIVAALRAQDPTWHPKTVQTLLTRLVRKRAVGFKKEGRSHLYRPLVSERQCMDAASESFLGRVFGGSLAPMVAYFVERKKLTDAEIRELQRILNGKE